MNYMEHKTRIESCRTTGLKILNQTIDLIDEVDGNKSFDRDKMLLGLSDELADEGADLMIEIITAGDKMATKEYAKVHTETMKLALAMCGIYYVINRNNENEQS